MYLSCTYNGDDEVGRCRSPSRALTCKYNGMYHSFHFFHISMWDFLFQLVVRHATWRGALMVIPRPRRWAIRTASVYPSRTSFLQRMSMVHNSSSFWFVVTVPIGVNARERIKSPVKFLRSCAVGPMNSATRTALGCVQPTANRPNFFQTQWSVFIKNIVQD